MKRMLINATQEEELRMAMVDGQRLYDLNIELPASERKKANIYKGKITRIEPSLEAAFVNYGADRHGFLPLKEISSEYFVKEVESGKKVNIKDVLKEGQDIVVQIDKEERGNKGAALTTFVSLAGRFIVLKPNKARSGGVSRRIIGEDRDLARQSLRDVSIPDGMSVILRTAGIDRGAEELAWDLDNLLAVWRAILKVVVDRPSPFLIYRESNSVVRALRDYLSNDVGEILIDDEATYKDAHEFVEQVMPHNLRKLKHYTDPVPLFTRYQIETQIESAFAHSVILPSGGTLVIDHTEALVSIDINSARATKGGDIEATALNTNVEAADEIGRQLRLRDLGGLVVIDFIDMGPQKNQREVENRLREAVRQDRARVQIGKISRFGLLEMSRQRLRPSLGESSYLTCPRCSGIGNIRSVESLALAILRIIGEEARKERTAKVIAQLPVEVATYLLNEKRDWVQTLESRNDTQVILVANSLLETPHYQIRRVRDDQVDLPENSGTSYALTDAEQEQIIPEVIPSKKIAEAAAIATVVPPTPAPARKKPVADKKTGPTLWQRIKSLFGGETTKKSSGARHTGQQKSRGRNDSRRRGGQRSRGRNDGQRSNENRKTNRNKQPAKKRSKKAANGNENKAASSQGDQEHKQQTRDDNRDDNRKSGSKRRSRGGRRRRRSNENAETAAKPADQQAIAEQTDRKPEPAAEQKKESGPSAAANASEKADTNKSFDDTQPSLPNLNTDDKPGAPQARPAAETKKAEPKAVEAKPAEEKKKAEPKAVEEKPAEEKKKAEPKAVEAKPAEEKKKAEPKAVEAKPAEEKKKAEPKAVEAKPAEEKKKAEPKAVEAKPAEEKKKAEPKAVEAKPAEEKKKEAKPRPARKKATPENKPEVEPAKEEARPKSSSPAEKQADAPKGRLLPWEADAPAVQPPKSDDNVSEV
jgi:ribonuclease E